jgi:hypothetical protein
MNFILGQLIKFKLYGEYCGEGTYVENLFGGNRIVLKLTKDLRVGSDWKVVGSKVFIFDEEIV